MEPALPLSAQIAGSIELLLALAGFALWWPLLFCHAARARLAEPPRLRPWSVDPVSLTLAALGILLAALVAQVAARQLLPFLRPDLAGNADLSLLLEGGAMQSGLFLGALVAGYALRVPPPAVTELPPASSPSVFIAGPITFIAMIPAVLAVSLLWTQLLQALGYELEPQEIVLIFSQTDSPLIVALTAILAVFVAPVAEELIFRAGLFRFLRTRTSRPLAFALPAAIFASLHGNIAAFPPLFLLGLIFSFAYERTGRITVTIVAHALFNLHTLLLLLAGLTP